MPANLAPPPDYWNERDPLTNVVTDAITRTARQWLLSLTTRIQQGAQTLKTVPLTGQQAAIGATPIVLGPLAAGLYQISYYARITTPGSISSSLTVTIQWTDGTVLQTFTGAAMTGNLTTTSQSGVVLANVDSGTNITYSTAYASNAAGMTYALTVVATALT